jgi:hypothetical protein
MVFLYNNNDCANCSLRKMYKIAQRRLFWSETIAVHGGIAIVMLSVLAFTRQHRRLESRLSLANIRRGSESVTNE